MPEHKYFDPHACHVVCTTLIALGIIILSGTTTASSSQAHEPGPRKPQPLPPVCQNLGKSNQRVGDLLTVLARHATAEAYNALGVLYAEGNKLNCAVPAFEEALRLDEQDWRARYNLALALINKGEEAKAADHLHIVIQQKPDSPDVHNTVGSLLQQQGELEAAAEEFKAALKCDPAFALAALNLGQVLIDQKRYTAAIAYLQDILKSSSPPDLKSQLQMTLAVAYAESGDSNQAIGTLEQLIKAHPDDADARFNLGTVYAKLGPALGYQKAIANFKEALRIDPHNDAARYSLAKVLVQLGQFSDAIPYLSDYTHHQPNDAEGLHLLGSAYTGLSQLPKAVEALERARQLKPDDYEIRYDLGSALAKTGKTNEAIEQLNAAEKINPNSADVHYQLALQLRKQGDVTRSKQEMQIFQGLKNQVNEETSAGNLNNEGNRLLGEGKVREAAEAYRKAVQLDPNNAQWQYNLFLALAKLGDKEGEKVALEKALQLDPNLATAHNDLGLVYLSEGKMNEAEREFRAALDIDPKFAEAQNNLGVVYNQQGKDSEASTLFRQATESDPTYTRAFVNLGLVMARQGNFPAAKEQIQQALKVSPNDVGALAALGMVEGKMKHHPESVQAFRQVASLRPESSDAHLNLGIALADQYDLKGALGEFSETIRVAPNYSPAYYNKGRVLYDLDHKQEALPFLDMACRLQPNYPSALYLLALALGASPRAMEVLDRLVTIDPENAEAHYLLGQNLLRAGKTQEAIEHWKSAVRLDPQNLSSLYNLARTLAEANDPQAQEYMERFQALQKTQQSSDRVQTLNNFALEAANAHDWPQAVEQLQESIKACGQCKQLPVLHRNLGLIFARQGDIQAGERELEMALQIDPNDSDAQSALQVLRAVPPPSNPSPK
jgi:tetratricopeptide (TPR) repeat protein